MAEEVKPEIIKKTQDMLGKFIKKPTLTEKLLKKPPFRFLHDICTSVVKETRFLEDVLNSSEDKIENIKDKEGKIAFLQKVIAAVEAASEIKLTVRPNKIVAGLEATKTNEFLQALGKAIENKLEYKTSKTSQPTKIKSTKKTPKEIKEEPPDKKKSSSNKISKKIVENGEHEPNDEQRASILSKKKHSSKKIEEYAHAIDEKKQEIEKQKEKKINELLIEEKSEKKEDKVRVNKAITFGAGESKDVPDVEFITINFADGQGDQSSNTKEEITQDEEIKKSQSGKHKHRRSSIQNNASPTNETLEENDKHKTVFAQEKSDDENLNIINNSELNLKEQSRKTFSPSEKSDFTKRDPNLTKEGTLISRPRTGIRPTTARPASARPAAPRIRDRGEIAVVEEVIKPVAGKVQVIEDKDSNIEAEDENLISMETTTDIILEESTPILQPTISSSTEKEHGHLVNQILEAQKELEDDSPLLEQKTSGKTEIEWDSDKSKEATNREIEKLRSNIQMLTRTANPLGKLLDFFQEDMEIIQKEFESWKEKNSTLCLQIAHERSITEQMIEPLKIHLKELQQNIDEELEQISVVKASIIRNNDKINKLLTGI